MTPPTYTPPTIQPIGWAGLRTFLRWVMDDPSSAHGKAAGVLDAALSASWLSQETVARLIILPEPQVLEAIDALSQRMREYPVTIHNIEDYLRLWVGPLVRESRPEPGRRGVRLLQLDDGPALAETSPPEGGLMGFAWVRDFHPSPELRRDATACLHPGFLGRLKAEQVNWLAAKRADQIVPALLYLRNQYAIRNRAVPRALAQQLEYAEA